MIGWDNTNHPNEIDIFLRTNNLISVHIDGEPDGEGGYRPETVVRTYSIKRYGRAVVEQQASHRSSSALGWMKDLIQTILSFLPFG